MTSVQDSLHASAVPVSPYQRSVADYWNAERNPVNLRLGEVDGIYHHHYGIGEVDWSVLQSPPEIREAQIIKELHRLESAQADFLLDHLGPLGPADRVMDAGCGRGGARPPAPPPVGGGGGRAPL